MNKVTFRNVIFAMVHIGSFIYMASAKRLQTNEVKDFNSKWKTFLFPNLSACPTGATSDGTKKCECTATGATTDGTADCKCAGNFQFNDDKSACVGKVHRILKDNTPQGGYIITVNRSSKEIKGGQEL